MPAGLLGSHSRLFVTRLHPVCSEQVWQLERSIGLKDLAMAEMEEKIRGMEASTYDGVFVWKITEFARKRQEAITGRSPAIFSPGYCPPVCSAAACGPAVVSWACRCAPVPLLPCSLSRVGLALG